MREARHISQDPRVPTEAYRPTFVRSLAMAPVGRGDVIGALGAYWAERHCASAGEIEQLQIIADATALALVQIREAHPDPVQRRRANPGGAPADDAHVARARSALRNLIFHIGCRHGRPNALMAYAFALGCVAAATLLRQAVTVTGVQGLATFSTYYPAVLLAAMVGGRWPGLLAAALGGLAAYFFFMPPAHAFVPLTTADLLNLALYGSASALIVWIIDRHQRVIRRLRYEDARHLTLAREQVHRVRNALTIIEAIVRQSLRDAPNQANMITQRIRSGLVGVDLEDGAASPPITLRELLASELQPYDLDRFVLSGEGEADVTLVPDARRLLTLALHELATNAVKYGSLSRPEGRVSVTWRVAGGATTIGWRESGGPRVQPPQKKGYGTVLLRRLIEAAGGALTMEFPPTGITTEISLTSKPAS